MIPDGVFDALGTGEPTPWWAKAVVGAVVVGLAVRSFFR